MKKHTIFFLLSIIIVFYSCDRNAGAIEFILNNNSDYDITIDAINFHNEGRAYDTTFILNKNKTNAIRYSDCIMDGASERPLDNAQDITIHFKDTLSITYYRDYLWVSGSEIIVSSRLVVSQYNPLRLKNYVYTKHKNIFTYTYTFTNEDVEAAVEYNYSTK